MYVDICGQPTSQVTRSADHQPSHSIYILNICCLAATITPLHGPPFPVSSPQETCAHKWDDGTVCVLGSLCGGRNTSAITICHGLTDCSRS